MTLSNRTFILLEVLAFVTFALTSKALVSLVAWKYAGPITLITTLVILTLYMKRRGMSWKSYGLKPLPGIKAKLLVLPQSLLVFVAFAAAVGPVLLLAEYFQIALFQEVSQGVEDRFGEVRDNLPRYLMWLGIVWVSAAFGEEMFFRGYLITRLQEAFSRPVLGSIVAVVIAAVIFGYGHMGYQGLRGFVITGLIAVAFGIMYLVFKKSLWPIILVHGVVDTINFTALYLGVE